MVEIKQVWEEVHVEYKEKDDSVSVVMELTINHDESKFQISSPHQDNRVDLSGTSIELLSKKIKCLQAIQKYLKNYPYNRMF